MIALLSYRCRKTGCGLGWVSTLACDRCPFCFSTDLLVGGPA